jgi:hypothetical protein
MNEPLEPGPIGDPPAYFNAAHCAVWCELIDESSPGLLTKGDRKMLELVTRLTVRMQKTPSTSPRWLTQLGPALERLGMDSKQVAKTRASFLEAATPSARESMLLSSFLSRLGMTPSGRNGVSITKSSVVNRFSTIKATSLS